MHFFDFTSRRFERHLRGLRDFRTGFFADFLIVIFFAASGPVLTGAVTAPS